MIAHLHKGIICREHRAIEIIGGSKRDLEKAVMRQKIKSVDWLLNNSRSIRMERGLMALFSEWRARAKKALTEAYAHAMKVDDDIVDQILRRLLSEAFSVDAIDELTPDLIRTFKEAGIAAIAEIGFDATPAMLEQVDAAAVQYAADHGADLVTQIGETTRAEMRGLVVGAVETGLSPQAFADDIEEAFGFSDARALMISRTELAFAHTRGNIEGWKESGQVERKKWIVAQDRYCDACAALAEQVVDLDEDFKSEEFGDVDAPPLHPNCRCDIVAVMSKEET